MSINNMLFVIKVIVRNELIADIVNINVTTNELYKFCEFAF